MPEPPFVPLGCGALFRQAEQLVQRTLVPELHMAAGFVVGQMEKVYLGACPAAMFAIPINEHTNSLRGFVERACHLYDLQCTLHEDGEVWVFRDEQIAALLEVDATSFPARHTLRGFLCGIPAREIDPNWSPSS